MRVAGYVRLSRDEDKENFSSILSQKSIIEQCALMYNWSIEKYYEDDNCSGYTFDRPAFSLLLKDLENDSIDIVIAKDLSRIGRHNAYTLLFIDRLKELGKRLILPKEGEGYDSNEEESDLLGIKTWYNEMYVKDISRKIRSSINAKQKEGRLIIKEHFGYLKNSSDKHKLDIDIEAAEIVRLIFRLYISGLGYRRIAEMLSERGYPTPSQYLKQRLQQRNTAFSGTVSDTWTTSAVQRILKNDIYIGTLRLGKTEKRSIKGKSASKPLKEQYVFEGNHTPIVTKEDFELVQSILNRRKKTGSKGAASMDNIFSGLLYCQDCGSYMVAYNKEGKARSYICGSYHKYGRKSCQRHTVTEDVLESSIKEYLRLAAQALEKELRKLPVELPEACFDDKDVLIEMLKQEQKKLKEKYKLLLMQKIGELAEEKDLQYKSITEQGYKELERDLHNRLLYLDRRIVELEQNLGVSESKEKMNALQLLYRVIDKPRLNKKDMEIIVDRIIIDRDGNPVIFFNSDNSSICKHIRGDVN